MTDTLSEPPSVDPVRPKPKRRLPYPLNIYQTAVGKKWVTATSRFYPLSVNRESHERLGFAKIIRQVFPDNGHIGQKRRQLAF